MDLSRVTLLIVHHRELSLLIGLWYTDWGLLTAIWRMDLMIFELNFTVKQNKQRRSMVKA
jgi:hypothetical protein